MFKVLPGGADKTIRHKDTELRGRANGEARMAGQVKHMLDSIIEQRAKGNPLLIQTTKAKLTFKGLDPDRFNGTSPDDPAVIAKVRAVAGELGIRL